MKTKTTTRWKGRIHHKLPFAVQVAELVIGLVIFSGISVYWGVLVRADGDITPPSVPTSLAVTAQSATEIDISWTASTDNVGVSGYYVYRNGTQVGSPTGTSFADTGLSPNTSYTYTVSAYDTLGNVSSPSAPLVSYTLADTSPPSVPTDLHQTGQSVTSVTIAWNPSTDNVGVAGYKIYRNGSLIQIQTATSYTDTGLAVYSGYDYNVTAFDAAGNTSNLSSTLVASTEKDTFPPSVPDNIQETGQTASSITLSWDASTDVVGVAGYHVYRNGSLVGSPGTNTFTDSGLNFSSSYVYTITAYDAYGNVSNPSAAFTASSSNDTTPPTEPLNVHTTSVLDNAVTIAWDASTDPFGVSGYKIYRNDSLVGTSETTSFSDTGLLPSTQYSYTVEAYNVANLVSTPSLALNVTTAFDTTPPSVPTGLHSTGQTDLSISLSWNASTDNVAVSGYDVFRNGTLVTSTIGTSFTDSGLSVDTAYVYTVLAYDTSGNDSAQSTPLDVSTLIDTTPPTIPQQLASPSQTISTINLTWDAATDPVGVTGYDVYRNGTFLRAVSGTTYADTGLHYNTNYNYTVAAFDQYNNKSSPSQALSVSTLPDTVPPSVSLTSPGNGASIKLNVPLAATASDAFGVTKVEFFVDSTLITTLTSPPYTFSWNSYAVHNGAHTLTAEAFDTPGNTATQSAAVTVDNPPPPLVGDFNDDHIVNILDLSYLLSNWGRSNSVISQSLNHSGNVGIIDLSIFLSHYGENDSDYN